LLPENTSGKSSELVYINIDFVGKNGVVESNDDHHLTFTVEGGTQLGFGNANPCTEKIFDTGI